METEISDNETLIDQAKADKLAAIENFKIDKKKAEDDYQAKIDDLEAKIKKAKEDTEKAEIDAQIETSAIAEQL